jgi:hypothetical protein
MAAVLVGAAAAAVVTRFQIAAAELLSFQAAAVAARGRTVVIRPASSLITNLGTASGGTSRRSTAPALRGVHIVAAVLSRAVAAARMSRTRTARRENRCGRSNGCGTGRCRRRGMGFRALRFCMAVPHCLRPSDQAAAPFMASTCRCVCAVCCAVLW